MTVQCFLFLFLMCIMRIMRRWLIIWLSSNLCQTREMTTWVRFLIHDIQDVTCKCNTSKKYIPVSFTFCCLFAPGGYFFSHSNESVYSHSFFFNLQNWKTVSTFISSSCFQTIANSFRETWQQTSNHFLFPVYLWQENYSCSTDYLKQHHSLMTSNDSWCINR